jgi:amino acid permease
VVCLGPRDPVDIAGPRPLSGVVVRPLKFTVRGAVVTQTRAYQVYGAVLATVVLLIPFVGLWLRDYMRIRNGNWAMLPFLTLRIAVTLTLFALVLWQWWKRTKLRRSSGVDVTSNNRWRGP